MTIKDAFKQYNKIEIELLLAHVLKKPKEFVFMHPDYNLPTYQTSKNLSKPTFAPSGPLESPAFIIETRNWQPHFVRKILKRVGHLRAISLVTF